MPASSMAKPAAMNMTRKPPIRNSKVLKMYAVSLATLAGVASWAKAAVVTDASATVVAVNAAPFVSVFFIVEIPFE